MKKVIVTGATGFIGRQALPLLEGAGWEVHGLHYSSRPPALPGVRWHQVNLLDDLAVRKLFGEIRASHCMHFAWYSEPGKYWKSPENFRWVVATQHLLAAFGEAGGRRMVMAGTCAEYDWAYGYCSESLTPLAPATLYGECKDATRRLAEAYAGSAGLTLAWGRIFYLYGPHEAPARLVPAVVNALLQGREAACTHGNQIRDYLHVADVAAAFVHVLESDLAGAVNIGSGLPVSVREVVEEIARFAGRPDLLRLGTLPAPVGEPPLIVADSRRLAALGWTPSHTLQAGLRRTVEWWRAQEADGARQGA